MWIERFIVSVIGRYAQSFPAVLLTGPRQVGKTSLLQHLYPQSHYYSFDSPSLARQAEETPDIFLASLSCPCILDEVQYVPSLFRYLKIKIDENKEPGRFLLTGSQTFPLMQGVSESLAGRCGILEMQSLAWKEVENSFTPFSDLEYLVRGGYPALYSGGLLEKEDWYGSYLNTYLERDVRNLKNVGDLRDFERLLRALAVRVGQLLSYSDLAKDVGISPNTVKQWVLVLQASGQIFLLEPYHRSLGKRLVKSPKAYFIDTGLACYLLGIRHVDDLQRSPLIGSLWENHVLGQVFRFFFLQGKKPPVWFWRTGYGDEVDLLIEQGARFVTLECKWSEKPDSYSLKGLQAFEKFYGKTNTIKGFIASRTKHSFKFNEGNYWAVPGSEIGEALSKTSLIL